MEDVFCQTFTAVLPGLGQHTEVALVAGGAAVMVTEDNRRQYVDAYVDCVLNRAVDLQFEVWSAGSWHHVLTLSRPPHAAFYIRFHVDLTH